jgi:hypothetical protein
LTPVNFRAIRFWRSTYLADNNPGTIPSYDPLQITRISN